MIKETTFSKEQEKLRIDFLKDFSLNHNLEDTRKLYQICFSFPPVSEEFYRECIEIEKSSSTPDKQIIHNLYSKATETYGKVAEDLWLEFISWETNNNDFTTSSLL